MEILTIDPARTTGWALWDVSKPYSAIESGSIELKGKDKFHRTAYMSREFMPFMRRGPDFITIEAPLPNVPKKGNIKGSLDLNYVAGAFQMMAEAFRISYRMVPPQTWHTVIPKRLKAEYFQEDGTVVDGGVKRRVRLLCDELGIVSPNQDSRDAAIMAVWTRLKCPEFKLLEAKKC